MWRDIRFGARTLRRSPGFAVAAILALGIGANTAIFSLIDEILLRPFPLPHPAHLAQVYSFNRKTRSRSSRRLTESSFSPTRAWPASGSVCRSTSTRRWIKDGRTAFPRFVNGLEEESHAKSQGRQEHQ
jgi:hypothetical protein